MPGLSNESPAQSGSARRQPEAYGTRARSGGSLLFQHLPAKQQCLLFLCHVFPALFYEPGAFDLNRACVRKATRSDTHQNKTQQRASPLRRTPSLPPQPLPPPSHPAPRLVAALVLDVHHPGLLVGGAEASFVPLEGVVGVLAALRELARPAMHVHLACARVCVRVFYFFFGGGIGFKSSYLNIGRVFMSERRRTASRVCCRGWWVFGALEPGSHKTGWGGGRGRELPLVFLRGSSA